MRMQWDRAEVRAGFWTSITALIVSPPGVAPFVDIAGRAPSTERRERRPTTRWRFGGPPSSERWQPSLWEAKHRVPSDGLIDRGGYTHKLP